MDSYGRGRRGVTPSLWAQVGDCQCYEDILGFLISKVIFGFALLCAYMFLGNTTKIKGVRFINILKFSANLKTFIIVI